VQQARSNLTALKTEIITLVNRSSSKVSKTSSKNKYTTNQQKLSSPLLPGIANTCLTSRINAAKRKWSSSLCHLLKSRRCNNQPTSNAQQRKPIMPSATSSLVHWILPSIPKVLHAESHRSDQVRPAPFHPARPAPPTSPLMVLLATC
jgi:hypothetical protein